MKRKVISLLLLVMGCAQAATTLQDAVEQTVLRNPEVRAKWISYKASHNEQDVARGNYYPSVDLSGYVGREKETNPQLANPDVAPFNHPGGSVTLRQMLFDGFATRDEVRRLGYAKVAKYYEFLSASDDAALQTTTAYLDVLRYRELVALARENYAIHKETLDQISERVNAGVGRRVDLETATGRMALAESNWLTELSNLQDVSARYERLVGLPPAMDLATPPDLAALAPKTPDDLRNGLTSNPDFLAAVYNIRSARADAENKKSNYYPQFELRASQGFDNNRDGVAGNYRNGNIQLVMNYNLFRGGSDSARVRQYADQLNVAYELRDKVCRDIRQTTQIAWNDTLRLKEQLRYQDQHTLSTEKSRDAFRRQFDIGQRTLLDVLDTENELFEAKRAYVRTKYDYQLSFARVMAQTNQLLPALKLAPLETNAPDSDYGYDEASDMSANCTGPLMAAVTLDREAAMADRPQREDKLVAAAKESSATPVAASPDKAVADAVNAWAAAWAGKNVDRYIGSYGKDFVPDDGKSRTQWEAQRRARLAKPGAITVSLEHLVSKVEAGKASVSFTQHYSSANYADSVQKTLELVQESGQWKILRERTIPAKAN